MIAKRFQGDGTVTEEHLRTFVADIEPTYPHCEDMSPETDPGSHLQRRLPATESFEFLIARDIDIYSLPRTPRFVRHIVGFEQINEEIDPTGPVKVQTTYQVGVDTMEGQDCEPRYTKEFVITHFREDPNHSQGWSPVPRQADRYYADPVLGIPVWSILDLGPDVKLSLEAELAHAHELDSLAEAIRHADTKPAATDLERFNQFHGLLLTLRGQLDL